MLGELTHEQIEQLLHSQFIGRIGCHYNGETYIVPVTFAYDEEYVYAHSGDGKKIQMMRQNNEVCFEAEHIESMGNWQTVIAQGTFEELHGKDAEHGMKILTGKLSPVVISETMPGGHLITTVDGPVVDFSILKAVSYRIKLHKKTGRFEKQIIMKS